MIYFIIGLDDGNGGSEVRSLKEFDREKQKYYLMPIIIEDVHNFAGTSTLTITIGDENDNDHKPGHKEINIYNYEGKIVTYFILHLIRLLNFMIYIFICCLFMFWQVKD
jgi:hypothetical protein